MQKILWKIRTWMRPLCAFLLVGSMLLITGCDVLSPFLGTKPTGSTVPTGSTETTQGGFVETVPTQQPTVDAESSLNALRQAMVGTTQTFAVAYFGWGNIEAPKDVFDWMMNCAPQLCSDLPFLLSIPEEKVFGQTGDIFCIVPANPDASVAVYRRNWDTEDEYEYSEHVYISKAGDPILLLCNYNGLEPDTEVIITDPDGTQTVWYPQTNSELFVMPLYNDHWDTLFFDFTSYAEYLASDYFELQEENWELPTREDLIGQAWGMEELLKDGRETVSVIYFDTDTAYVRWTTGYDDDYHVFEDASWDLTYEQGFAVLTIDFREFAGILRYNLLYDEETGWLYTMVDASTGNVTPGSLKLFRYLEPISINAPEPLEMVGTWERFRYEIEGYEEEDTSGSCTIRISGMREDSLSISFTDVNRPSDNYQNRPLIIRQGAIYAGCGNDLWRAEVDYTGPYGTTYTITLLEDGTLLVQNYWLMDGAPMVSYEWFRRIS